MLLLFVRMPKENIDNLFDREETLIEIKFKKTLAFCSESPIVSVFYLFAYCYESTAN